MEHAHGASARRRPYGRLAALATFASLAGLAGIAGVAALGGARGAAAETGSGPAAAGGSAAGAAGSAEAGRRALEAVRVAYRGVPELRETLTMTLDLPNGRREHRRTDYGVDRAGRAFLTLANDEGVVLRIAAADGRMVGTQAYVPGRYAEAPYHGDFAAALARLGGEQAQLGPPPAVVARQGGSFAGFMEALRLGVLGPLEITGSHPGTAADATPLV